MSITAVTGLALAAAVLSVVLRQHRPEFSLLVSLAAALVIFASQIDKLARLRAQLGELTENLGSAGEFAAVVLKGLGICLIVQIAADTCRDAGESAIASKLEISGKLAITAMSMPLVFKVLENAADLITKGMGI